MIYTLREYTIQDAEAINQIALAAFEQFKDCYTNWPAFSQGIGRMASLADSADLIVAESPEGILGAVGYVGPGKPKANYFEPEWAIMRMLVVKPSACGQSIGKALAEECIVRAQRDQVRTFALHTSKIMNIALPMYLRMGFEWLKDIPVNSGVQYAVYVKKLPPS